MLYPIGIQNFKKLREGGFVYIDKTEKICSLVSDVVSSVSLYHLECLPDTAAAELSYNTVFGTGRRSVDNA